MAVFSFLMGMFWGIVVACFIALPRLKKYVKGKIEGNAIDVMYDSPLNINNIHPAVRDSLRRQFEVERMDRSASPIRFAVPNALIMASPPLRTQWRMNPDDISPTEEIRAPEVRRLLAAITFRYGEMGQLRISNADLIRMQDRQDRLTYHPRSDEFVYEVQRTREEEGTDIRNAMSHQRYR